MVLRYRLILGLLALFVVIWPACGGEPTAIIATEPAQIPTAPVATVTPELPTAPVATVTPVPTTVPPA